ncbi:MAG: NAD(P)H-hydrate dehydratase [bacterium]
MLNKNLQLPKRKVESHKGDYGRALIVAGSPGMTGAAILASRGALRVGTGLTYLALPKELVNFVDMATPEVITLPFENIAGVKASAAAIGPGLGTSNLAKKLLIQMLAQAKRLVIDADGINLLAQDLKLLKKIKGEVVLTPHPGEMARLVNRPINIIQDTRVNVAKEVAGKYNCIVVLKGHKTVVAEPNGEVYVNETGNPGMASGGVGDVLAGMITGLLAQGLSAWDAAVTGVYLHGKAGDLAAKEKGEYGMIASDLVEKIPYAL